MKIAITCLFICIQGLVTLAQIGRQRLFKSVTVDDGLSQNSVVSTAQDSAGYLWFATLNGLNRYDGKTFKQYEKQFGYVTREQFSKPGEVYVDRQGRLWIITDGQLERYQKTTDDFESMAGFSDVTKIYQAHNLDFYIASYHRGVFRVDAKTNDTLKVFDSTQEAPVVLDFYELDGKIWMACNDAVYTYDPQLAQATEMEVHGANDKLFSTLAYTSDGTLWLGSYTEGLFCKTAESDRFRPFPHPKMPTDLSVSDLLPDSKNNLWISTYGNGVYVYRPHTKEVTNYRRIRNHPFTIQHNDIPSLYQDQQDVVWVGTDGMGAFYYDPYLFKFNVLTNAQLPEPVNVGMVRAITTDAQGRMWIGTSGNGLTVLNTERGAYTTYTAANSPLLSDRVVSLMHNGTDLWIGYAGHGLSIMEPSGKYLAFPELASYHIYGIVGISATQSWLCTEQHGLICFDKYKGITKRYHTGNSKLPTNNILVVGKATDEILWIGTADDGVFRLSLATDEIEAVDLLPGKIKSLHADGDTLWVGTNGNGLKKYDSKADTVKSFTDAHGLSDSVIYGILPDAGGNLWLSSNKGIDKFNIQQETVTPFDNTNYLQSYEFNTGAYHRDSNGWLYFGGVKGLNWFNPERISSNPYRPKAVMSGVKAFDKERQLSDEVPFKHSQNTITFSFAALQFSQPERSQFKYRLVGNDAGWSRPQNSNEVRYTNLPPGNYTFQVLASNYDGLWSDVPAEYRFEIDQPWHFTQIGKAVFTTFVFQGCFVAIGLFIIFLYVRFRKQEYLLYGIYVLTFALYFFLRIDQALQTGLFFDNPDTAHYFLLPLLYLSTGIFVAFVNRFADIKSHSPRFSKEVVVFSKVIYGLAFLSLLYLAITRNYELVIANRGLILLPLHVYAIYAVIRAVIVVKSSFRYYILVANAFLIGFTMLGVYYSGQHPPLVGVEANTIYGFYSFNISQLGVLLEVFTLSVGLGHKFYLIEIERNKIQRLDELKTNLYTNISHEIRTPLTLIAGPVDNQLKRENLSDTDRNELLLVKQNADRLLTLVNQMLDLSVIDGRSPKLLVSAGNMEILLKQLFAAFRYQAEAKDQHMHSTIGGLTDAWFDPDVVEKVVGNLLANAIKYAPKGTEIRMEAHQRNELFVLTVTNKTADALPDDPNRLFDRFYRHSTAIGGAGVGLALVKELVALCRGTVTAHRITTNEICFTVEMPVTKEAFAAGEISVEPIDEGNAYQTIVKYHTDVRDTVLIVEDDDEIRDFVASIFHNDYHILAAKNGQEGVERTMDKLPDLVISDVMMPVMDGVECCRQIKTNVLTSHIPVILLTAKVGEENEIQGFRTGADAYVTKPFNAEKLTVIAAQLIGIRKRLAEHYKNTFSINPDLAIADTEQAFLKQLKAVLDEHITDTTFNNKTFSQLMQMSERQLHRKLKAIIGMTPTEFVRNERVKLAAGLLETSDATVAEIAYQVGFNTPSYFIKCFKVVYGCTPNTYNGNP